MSDGRFRILSLDGGGVKGAFTAAVLSTIEAQARCRLVDYFDLIAGTSTGGIIALGLALGVETKDIEKFYREEGPLIFPAMGTRMRRWRERIKSLFQPKYPADALRSALEKVVGGRRLGEAKTRLVIPSYDAAACNVHVFKTAHHEKFREDYMRDAVDVALATSAAPTILPLFNAKWDQHFLDGGVWANCPAVVAILEAQCALGHSIGSIDLLRVGTTEEPFHILDNARSGGLLSYGSSIVHLFRDAQEKAITAQIKFLLRPDQVITINETVRENRFRLDGAEGIGELIALGRTAGRHNADKVIKRFLQSPTAPFVPVHSLS